MQHLFAYGTLMSSEIFRAVAGVRMDSQPAVLVGFSRWSVRGEVYPAIIVDEAGRVQGVVYRNLPDAVWQLLDLYEGEAYIRRAVAIRLGDGTLLPAAAYVWRAGGREQLEGPGWRFDDFMRRHGAEYLRACSILPDE